MNDDQKTDPEQATGPGSLIEPLESSASGSESSVPSSVNPSPAAGPTKKSSVFKRFREFSNLYFIIFAFLLVMAIAATIVALTRENSQKSNNKKTSSLTSEQLSQLQGNTTIVGDSSQILDIQSNTVLEGQLLVRKDLEVAGSIKVGGGLALSSVTVGGQGNFGQLQINGILSVSGDTTFSGQLNIQKNLNVTGSGSFGGNLTANQLTISTLKLNGDLQINRHIAVSGSLPARSNGSALGSGGTASVNGSDAAGTVTINTGGSPPSGCFVTVTFANAYGSTPHVIVSPSNSSAAGLNYYASRTSTNFKICTTSTPSAGKTYLFDYVVFD